jgi:hypothetical protein
VRSAPILAVPASLMPLPVIEPDHERFTNTCSKRTSRLPWPRTTWKWNSGCFVFWDLHRGAILKTQNPLSYAFTLFLAMAHERYASSGEQCKHRTDR